MLKSALVLLMHACVAVGPDTVVVCPDEFVPALQPWVDHRSAQGHRLSILSNRATASQIRKAIRDTANQAKLNAIVLIGDAHVHGDVASAKRQVPAHRAKAKINVKWGSEPEIGTDNWYADLDNDQVPDVAIGRLTADTPQELSAIVEKILAYERSSDMGQWRRRVHFVAGVGGFGAIADMLLETATKKFITDGVPAPYESSMTYGSWRSPYCPDPRDFHRVMMRRFNEGSLATVYIGHGQRTFLDRVRVPGAHYHIMDVDDVENLQCNSGAPIAVFLACYAGAFDEPRDCIAEEMLRHKGGPVAVICGSRVTMPYAMSVMGLGMLDEMFANKRKTLGEVFLHGKRRLADTEKASPNRRMLDTLASAISPMPDDLPAERAEHQLLFNLIGDPLLRLHHPSEIDIATKPNVESGSTIEVTAKSPVTGKATIEFVCRRDRLTFSPPNRSKYKSANDELAAYNRVYESANDHRWSSYSLDMNANQPAAFRIRVPDLSRGPCHVRIFIEGQGEFAMGAANVYVRPKIPRTTEASSTDN